MRAGREHHLSPGPNHRDPWEITVTSFSFTPLQGPSPQIPANDIQREIMLQLVKTGGRG